MLELIIDDGIDPRLTSDELQRLEQRLARMLRAAWLTEATDNELEMSVRLTDDDQIWQLNRDYRDKDRPTDVLAFSQREGDGPALHPELLGDVVVSVDTAARQAKQTLFDELVFLCAHGLCHLLGYDHRDDEEEAAMNARMEALIAEGRGRGPTKAA